MKVILSIALLIFILAFPLRWILQLLKGDQKEEESQCESCIEKSSCPIRAIKSNLDELNEVSPKQ